MKDSLHSYMKVGIVSHMAFPDAPVVPGIMKIAEDSFFSAIEISPHSLSAKADVLKVLKASHLTVGFSAQVTLIGEGLDLNSLDKAARDKAVARMKETVDECYTLGVKKMAVISGPDPGADKRGDARKAIVESLTEICRYTAGKGNMEIVIELFDRDVDRKRFLGPTKEGAQVAADVRKTCPNFGLMIDLSHVPLVHETPEQAIKTAGVYLSHVHVGNCVLEDRSSPWYGDKHPYFGAPNSCNDVEQVMQFLKALMSIGYIGPGKQNVVAFEVKPMGDEVPEIVIAGAKRTLLEAWARL